MIQFAGAYTLARLSKIISLGGSSIPLRSVEAIHLPVRHVENKGMLEALYTTYYGAVIRGSLILQFLSIGELVENFIAESAALPDCSRFGHALESLGLLQNASEIHGVICGMLCAGTSQVHVDWIEGLFGDLPADDLLVQEARQMLGQLYQASRQQLSDPGLGFTLLLPDDNAALLERVQSLVNWVEGYLYGLGMGGASLAQLAGDAKEALHDISAFTQLDLDDLQEGESDESAYMELQEFLRVSTLLIREELASAQEGVDGSE